MTRLHPNVARTLSDKRGGKGRLSPREACLARALRAVPSYVVPTGKPRPYPRYYHIDVAIPLLQIAIEIDGPSHRTAWVRRADQRKTRLLRERGWSVLRFTNEDIERRLAESVQRARRVIERRRNAQ